MSSVGAVRSVLVDDQEPGAEIACGGVTIRKRLFRCMSLHPFSLLQQLSCGGVAGGQAACWNGPMGLRSCLFSLLEDLRYCCP